MLLNYLENWSNQHNKSIKRNYHKNDIKIYIYLYTYSSSLFFIYKYLPDRKLRIRYLLFHYTLPPFLKSTFSIRQKQLLGISA